MYLQSCARWGQSEYKTAPKGKSILVVETNVTGILKYCFVSKPRFFYLYFILCHSSMGFWSDRFEWLIEVLPQLSVDPSVNFAVIFTQQIVKCNGAWDVKR